MRLPLCTVALGLLAVTAPASAQARTEPARELRVVSPIADREIFFRVELDSIASQERPVLQLLGSSAVMKNSEGVQIQTPAVLAITTEVPFEFTLVAQRGGQQIEVILQRENKEIQLSGERLRFARRQSGGAIEVVEARAIHVRSNPGSSQ